MTHGHRYRTCVCVCARARACVHVSCKCACKPPERHQDAVHLPCQLVHPAAIFIVVHIHRQLETIAVCVALSQGDCCFAEKQRERERERERARERERVCDTGHKGATALRSQLVSKWPPRQPAKLSRPRCQAPGPPPIPRRQKLAACSRP